MGQAAYSIGGQLEVWFEDNIPAGYVTAAAAADADRYFGNLIDGIVDDCQALTSAAGWLIVRRWELIEGPGRLQDRQVYLAKYRVTFGLD